MENRVLKKIIIFMTVFMIVFSNCGYTIQALAATDGITLFGFNIFGSGNIDFDAYFLDSDGNKQTENISDVNSEVTMVLELTPKAEGYLKAGTIKAVSKEGGEANFKFSDAYVDTGSNSEKLTITSQADTELLQSEIVIDAEDVEFKDKATNEIIDEITTDYQDSETNNTVNENSLEKNEVVSENTNDNNSQTNETPDANSVVNNVQTSEALDASNLDNSVQTSDIIDEDEFADEEANLSKVNEGAEILQGALAKATIASDNEINIESVIENTKIYVNISFKTGETLNIEALYKDIVLEFEGTYVNVNLEEVPVSMSETVRLGWSYSKDVEVSSEYTKVSPFRIGDTEGTIVEDTITIKRNINEENYLPLKETKISLKVPNLAGNLPTDLDVSALKLKATSGEDINSVSFSSDNWEYDLNNNTLNIKVENTNGIFTYGEDIYVVTYRYNTYVEEAEVSLETKGSIEVTEFSSRENNVIVKNLDESQKIVANVGELITYSIGTTEEKINKGKINANYNQAEEKYESLFDTTVNVNILTNDVLSEFTLKDTKEFYIDKEGLEFETSDIKYKNIKFKYEEIQGFLENGGTIEIKNNTGELLYTLNKDLVKSDEAAEVSIQGDVRGIEISFKNITVNGNISIEFVKAIGKSSYDKSAISNFKKLESRINAVVKYSENSEGTDLPQIKTEKEFEESKTEAEITMNKVSLSTTELNTNVEFKIELNNDKDYSDLYVNPVFEIALPKYVENIDLKAINILYESGLTIGNSTVYRAEDGTLRMRIEVKGTQTEFCESTITNGTNIIVNANVEVDKYAPRKDEQVKLYYINEGVTNYTSQTKWTIGMNIPSGILKTTNGFDSYVFKLNAPNGFIAINEIQNYDGANSSVTSIKQGEETREIEMEKPSQIATMNLIAINNTENKCTDVAFLGRVPSKNATNVKTEEVLETNIDTIMVSKITENENNPLSAKIYYSSNSNANKNLDDSTNGWTENVEDVQGVKSFLIVPDNTVEPGYIFKYTYEFLIPENLPYESKIYGAFGAFYNNHSDVAITYEATSADLVGVVTKSGPKVEAKLSVDIGDGAKIQEAGFLDYTLTIVNSGSVDAEGITVTNPISEGTKLYTERLIDGDLYYGWFASEDNELSWQIDKLKPGEVKEFNYTLKTNQISEGNEIIENKATVHIDNLALDIESNKTQNNLIDSDFDIETYSKVPNNVIVGNNFIFAAEINNISGKDLSNITIEYKVPEELMYNSFDAFWEEEAVDLDNNYNFDAEKNVLTLMIPNWKSQEKLYLMIHTAVIAGNSGRVSNLITLKNDTDTIKSSKSLDMNFKGPKLEAVQVSSALQNTIQEGENVEFVFSIQNVGNAEARDVSIYSLVSENLENVEIYTSGSSKNNLNISNGNELVSIIYNIPRDESLDIHISGTAKEVEDDSESISSKMLISNQYIDDITTNEIVLQILNDPNKIVEQPVVEEEKNIINSDIIEDTIDEEEINNSSSEQSSNQINNTQNVNNQTQEQNNNEQQNNAQNNSTNDNSQNNNQNNTQDNANQNNQEQQVVQRYNISGKIWQDSNKNGVKDGEEGGIQGVQVQLQKNNINIKATVSSRDGSYVFRDVEPGKYAVIYTYNENLYQATVYKNVESGIENASYARDLNNGRAITDTITVGNENVENINLGLEDKDKFDLTISKNITLAKVITNGKTTEHKYENLDLAKLEISAKDLAGTTVELHYQIDVKNNGNVSGKAVQVSDYLPKDTVLDKEQSINWYLGSDGNVYNDSLNEITIAPGETRTLNLVLVKTMTKENTGVVGNKVVITKTEGTSDKMVENTSNNEATQELIISVKTGYTAPIIINVIVIAAIVTIIYLEKSQKIKLDLKNLKFKRIYK